MKEELVWVNRIYSKNFVTDFIQRLKNIIGGRLKAYERMVDDCIEDTWKAFKKKHPSAINIKVDTEHFESGGVLVQITGIIRK